MPAHAVHLALLIWFLGAAPLGALPAPTEPAACTRLGLAAGISQFELRDLRGEHLVLLLFDLYCPVCQKSAANFNLLASTLEADYPAVTVLGIGCGDTAFETASFVRRFGLTVPAVPDRGRSLAPLFGLSKTPSVLLLKRGPAGEFAPLFQHSGYFSRDDLTALLATLHQDLSPPS